MKSILITGGTGTVGEILVKSLISQHKVIVFSRDEYKQFLLEKKYSNPNLKCVVGDVRDRDALSRTIQKNNIDTVIHAAALKRIETIEKNPIEAVQTNIIGSINVLEASRISGVSKVLFISTDKANNPNSTYGASKMCGDKICIDFSSPSMLCSVIRFGNIFGSRGSVVEIFENQSDKSLFEVTCVNSTRTIISFNQLSEFTQKVIENMRGGEIFIPKIPSMRIVDLVHAFNESAEIKIIGLRPGERKHEVMISNDCCEYTYDIGDLYVIAPNSNFYSSSQKVPSDFYYGTHNNIFLDVNQLRDLLQETREYFK